MAIVQEIFDIPEDIMIKLNTKEYRRIGGVVRYASGPKKGQIVKHLEPVNLKEAIDVQGIGAKAIQFAKNNKKAIIIVGIGTGIAVAGTGIYNKLKNREPKVLIEFRMALKVYIDAIRKGTLEIEIIDNLRCCLDDIKNHKDYEKIRIQLSTEEIGILINIIHQCTEKLAKDNVIELTDEEKLITSNANRDILNLQDYLKVQRRIFEAA